MEGCGRRSSHSPCSPAACDLGYGNWVVRGPPPHLAVQLRDLVEEDAAVQLVENAAVVLDDAADVLDDAVGLAGRRGNSLETDVLDDAIGLSAGPGRGNRSDTPPDPPA